jgi:tRNA(fMet)-specific endonuclease VapC
MIYLLDTNIIAALIKPDLSVREKFKQEFEAGHNLSLSHYNHYEVIRGLELPEYQRKYNEYRNLLNQMTLYAHDLRTFEITAKLYQTLKAQGNLIEDPDLIIAATALQHGAILVTDNTKHFARVPHLQLENWIERS